jgi:hypothetical protein
LIVTAYLDLILISNQLNEMDLKHLSIYSVVGLIGLPNSTDVYLISKPGECAILTVNREQYYVHFRRKAAFVSNTAFPEWGSVDCPLLVVEALGSTTTEGADWKADRLVECGDFGFVVNRLGLDAALLAERCKPTLQAAVAGISLALPPNITPTIEHVGDITFAIEPETLRPLYSVVVSGSATLVLAASTSTTILEDAANYAGSLSKDDLLQSVVRLLSQSLQTHDNLLAFLSAWGGLEIFIQKTFKSTYEQQIYSRLTGAAAAAAAPFMKRLRDVMKDKYNIRDKFVVIASSLNNIDADADIQLFQQLKAQRDGVHEMRFSSSSLDPDKVRTLLRKYLRLHLDSLM